MEKQHVKRIFVLKDRCNGCRICELRCSFHHEKVYSPTLSRIYVVKNELEGYTNPKTCVLCGKCVEVCPVNAISFSAVTGAIAINVELCEGKQDCVEVCPFNVMRFNQVTQRAFTCDLCDGDPQCVKYCPEEALFYMTSKEFLAFRKSATQRKKPGVIP